MFLTNEVLDRYGACGTGRKWFDRNFPNGGELIDVINHATVTPYFLNWGYAHLDVSHDEAAAYWKKMNVTNCELTTIYESNDVDSSGIVSQSSFVKDSSYVFRSNHIERGNSIFGSSYVEGGSLVYNSDFVYDSKRVVDSKNVTNSEEVVSCDYVVNSRAIYNSTVINDSSFVGGIARRACSHISNSSFIADCHNLNRSLFCYDIEGGENIIFNKQVSIADYDLISRQLNQVIDVWMPRLTKNGWPYETVPLEAPLIQHNIEKQFAALPEHFLKWVKTIPWYDPDIFYNITFHE